MKDNIDFDSMNVNTEGFQIVKQTLKMFIMNFWTILIIVSIIAIPIETVKNYYFVPWSIGESFMSTIRRDGLVNILFFSLITPTLIYYLILKLNNTPTSLLKSFKWGIKKWRLIIGYDILRNIIVTAGLILLVIPGVIFLVRLILVPVIISIEGTNGIDPIGESNNLIKGITSKTLVYFLAVGIVVWVPTMFVGKILGFFFSSWISSTIIDFTYDVISQIFTIFALLLYVSIKQNKNKGILLIDKGLIM